MDNKIKITHVTRFAKPHIGGIEAVINQINESLSDDKFEKEVFCCSNTEKSSIDNGVKYNRFRYLFDFAANSISPQLFFGMMGLKTDILHFHMPVIQNVVIWFILYHLGLIKYKKMIITYHGAIIGYDKYMKPFWGLYRYFFKKADKIQVLSPTIIESDDILKQNRDKCVVIPFGIDVDAKYDEITLNKIKKDLNDNKMILSVGRIVKLKGFEYLIDAVKSVENTILYIMGEGPLKNEYEEYVKENNLQSKVFFLGEIRDEKIKNAYFKSCDILAVASTRTESFGITQLEAMRYSKPVINTWLNTGMNYVSPDEETGLTVEPENVEQFVDAINKLVNNAELCNQYGQNARKRVEQIFDINKIKESYKEFYSC